MTSIDIIERLNHIYLTNPKYVVNNLRIFMWESDFAACTRAGYWYEVEVKVSRADFRADFKKIEKHNILASRAEGLRPNYFAYAVPEGLIKPDEVPEYAGLIYFGDNPHYYTGGKPTPQLHKEKIPDEALRLTEKFYYNYKNLLQSRCDHQRITCELRSKISWLRAEFKAVAGYDIVKEI